MSNVLKYQNIAPAPSTDKTMPTRKYTPRLGNTPYGVDQTQSVARRNARERNRVKQVNNSFANLRQHIPQSIISDLTKGGGRGPHKKISKVDTLRIAVEYIRRLQHIVDDLSGNESENNSMNTPITTTTIDKTKSFEESASSPPLPAFEQTRLQIMQQQQQQHENQQQMHLYNSTSTQLNMGCHSPTCSFNSSMSFDSGTYEAPPQTLSPSSETNEHLNTQLQLKFETYESFNLHEEDCSPDDEEILDYISLWQDQQS